MALENLPFIDVFSMKISISTCQVWLPDGNEPSFAMVHASPPPSRHSHDGLRHWRPGQSLRVATRAPQAFFPVNLAGPMECSMDKWGL